MLKIEWNPAHRRFAVNQRFPRYFGVNYGFSTTPLMVASLCGPFLGGLVRAESGNYLMALYAAATLTLLGLLPALLLRKAKPFWN